MMDQQPFYTFRCSKCSCHFSNVLEFNGLIKVEKKCPKCKALNIITLTNKEITIQCKINDTNLSDNNTNGLENQEYWESGK